MVPGVAAAESALQTEKLTLVTATGRHEFDVEIADSGESRATGLMFRRELATTRGMLFIYETAQPIHMWMRNTYISLDMVFITSAGSVFRVERNTEPFSERIIDSGGDVLAVLEVAAGTANRLQLKPGDKVLHRSFRAASR
ncbi:MAG: DUF192 domain-containing protein [Methyloligellaceae bacterium]